MKFIKEFEKKVKKTIEDYNLFSKKDKIIVACSGGKDSTVALYLLNKIITNRKVSIEAIHVDVGIGNFSKENLKNLKLFCKENKIKFDLRVYFI